MKNVLSFACMLLVMVSCKKDEETNTPQTKSPMTEKQMSETEKRVLSFLEAIEQHDNGFRSNETMSYDEAVVLWENTINYCHSFTSTPLESIQFDTIYMKVEGVEGDVIGANSAAEAYNFLKEEVRELYSSLDIENKKIFYVMVDDYVSSTRSSGKEVEIVVMTGKEAQREDPPFSTTPWYGVPFVGEGYMCTAAESADYLENAIRDYYWSKVPIRPPYPDMYYVVYNLEERRTYTYPQYDWIYYGSPNTQLTYDDMNQLYADYMENGHSEDMQAGACGEDVYIETTVTNGGASINELRHVMKIWYGTREWRVGPEPVPGPEIGGEYPSDIDPED